MEWINVAEKLPECADNHVVFNYGKTLVACWHPEDQVWRYDMPPHCPLTGVTHWMPNLPSPSA